MTNFLGKILITALAALIAAYLLPGVNIDSSITAVLVAVVLALLNSFVKPLLIILTIPITIVTLGLFLIVINVFMIQIAANIVDGFQVQNWWYALLFSFLLSVVTSLLESLINKSTGNNSNNNNN
ncbi:phage holin family protein [Limnovirga soli]|uniref:Phage holin family protein n=1 Tax=Limnovirga soli TaxID=2656915 RepID=A0A8J8JT73_9BACT|nr:phage holin family protein [Limnovirga soli]NNV57752.1 phage holin family protein [Limnovirga soli]